MVTPKDREAIRQAIAEALQLDPNDALSRALAGRIALEDQDPATAAEQLKEAIRLRPNLAEAHYSLNSNDRVRKAREGGRGQGGRRELPTNP